jgi:restriction endonuclease S subunit
MSYKTSKIGLVCDFVRGLTYSKLDEVEFSKNIVLRATNINLKTLSLDLNELRYIDDKVVVKDEKKLKAGDILICTASGSKSHLGKVALIKEDMPMAFGGFMGVLRSNKNKINPDFLYKVLIGESFTNHIKSLSDGANINNLKFSQIEEFEFLLPPIDDQLLIVKKLDFIFSEIEKATRANEKKLIELTVLKNSFLNQAFTGELIKE